MVRSTHPPREDGGRLPDRLAAGLPEDHTRRSEYERLLAALRTSGGSCSIMDLTQVLVERKSPPPAAPSEAYRSAYLSLRRQHLPALVALGIVEYDGTDGSVTLTEGTDPRRTSGA